MIPFLKLFKDLTLTFSATTTSTISVFALEFEYLFVEIFENFTSDIESTLNTAIKNSVAKLTKYYSRLSNTSILASVVLDPRFKLDVYATTQDPEHLKSAAEKYIKWSFELYSDNFEPTSSDISKQQPHVKKFKFLKCVDVVQRSELEQYLLDPVVRPETDVLQFWNANQSVYPILSKMARDYLAIQPTSKDIEGTFSVARRVIPFYRRQQTGNAIRDQMLVNSGTKLGILDFVEE